MIALPILETPQTTRQQETAQRAQKTFAALQQWAHWNEIGLVAAKEYHMSEKQYSALLPEYQKFIALAIACDGGIGMFSADVDNIWHSHILSTMRYEDFCTSYNGGMIHHLPQITAKKDNMCTICESCRNCSKNCRACESKAHPTDTDTDSFTSFKEAYTAAFGELPLLWHPRPHTEVEGIAL